MIELPDSISPDDLAQWLHGGVCLCRVGNTMVPAIFDRSERDDSNEDDEDGDDGTYMARVRLITDNFQTRHYVRPSSLAGFWPLCGSINIPEHRIAVSVERIPARQYRRTLNSRQVRQVVPRGWDVRKIRGRAVYDAVSRMQAPVIAALFKPEYPATVDAAFSMLNDGWLSVAINRRIIVAQDLAGKRMIYYRGEVAATQSNGLLVPVADLTTCRLINRALNGRIQWKE